MNYVTYYALKVSHGIFKFIWVQSITSCFAWEDVRIVLIMLSTGYLRERVSHDNNIVSIVAIASHAARLWRFFAHRIVDGLLWTLSSILFVTLIAVNMNSFKKQIFGLTVLVLL